MKRDWQPEELVEHWTLLPDELALVANKIEQNKLGFALLLKFFQLEARFPYQQQEVPSSVVDYMGRQTGILPEKYQTYDWQGRTIKHHRTQIRNFFGFREATIADGQELTQWLTEQVLAYDLNIEHLTAAALVRVRQLKIEPPTLERLGRITRSAIRTFEERFFANTLLQIPPATREQIDRLLNTAVSSQELTDTSGDNTVLPPEVSSFSELKTDPGRIGVDSFQKEVAKLQQIRQLELPDGLFKLFSTKVLQIYKQRVTVEPPRDLRRHPDPIHYTLIAAFCWLRSQEITDNLVELLTSIVHRIGARAEQRVEKELLNDFKRVGGKMNLLFQLAEATLSQPDGLVKHVVFPVVSEQKLKDLVKEFKSTGSAYREKSIQSCGLLRGCLRSRKALETILCQ